MKYLITLIIIAATAYVLGMKSLKRNRALDEIAPQTVPELRKAYVNHAPYEKKHAIWVRAVDDLVKNCQTDIERHSTARFIITYMPDEYDPSEMINGEDDYESL